MGVLITVLRLSRNGVVSIVTWNARQPQDVVVNGNVCMCAYSNSLETLKCVEIVRVVLRTYFLIHLFL